jgi:hypothetical protein
MIEKVTFDVKVYDNFIEIIPKDGMKDNSLYEVKLNGLKSLEFKENIDGVNFKFVTNMSPLFCNLNDVRVLLDDIDVSEDIVLYNIREASNYANYVYDLAYASYHGTSYVKEHNLYHNVTKLDSTNIPFAVREFTRYKAAKECLLKAYMSLATDDVVQGALGDVSWKTREQVPDIMKIIQYLDAEVSKWLEAIRGFDLEGRARMRTAIRGYNHGGINPRTYTERKITPKAVPVSMDRGVY